MTKMKHLLTEVKSTIHLHARSCFTLILAYDVFFMPIEEATMTVKCRTATKSAVPLL